MDNEDQAPQGDSEQTTEAVSAHSLQLLQPGWRILVIGLVLVGVWALIPLDAAYTGTAGIAVVSVLLAGIVSMSRRSRPPISTAGVLVVIGAVVAVLSLLELLDLISSLDRLDDYGGPPGLIGFVAYFVGGLLMLLGAIRLWDSAHTRGATAATDLAERFTFVGGVVVIGAWVSMMLAPAWVLVTDQAIGVAGATVAIALVLLRRADSFPFSVRVTRIVLAAATTLAFVMTLYSFFKVLPERAFIIEVGGARVLVPYLFHLLGGAILGGASIGAVLSLLQNPTSKSRSVVAAGVALVGLVAFLASRGGEPAQMTATSLPTSSDAPTAAEGTTQYAPVDACSLLTQFEVLEALAPGHELEAILEVSKGRLVEGAGGAQVSEECAWEYYASTEARENFEWTMGIRVEPGDQSDFASGTTLGEATEAVSVNGVGDLAIWFPAEGEGIISVVEESRLGFVFVRVLVRQPEMDDFGRLEIAENLAAKVIERLHREPLVSVEVNLCELITDEEAAEVLAVYGERGPAATDLIVLASGLVDLSRPSRSGFDHCQKMFLVELYVKVATGLPTGFADGAELDGVAGEPIIGVGDQAVWFPGGFESSDNLDLATGVLNIRHDLTHFRIELGLPDTSNDQQLEIAMDLATKALGRLPGAPALLALSVGGHNLAHASFVDNLFARAGDDEWTVGEGLVDTLRLFAGEVDPAQVLRQPELDDYSGTGIIQLAREYLDVGVDQAAKAEIARLLDVLFFSREELLRMAGIEPPTAVLAGLPQTSKLFARTAVDLCGGQQQCFTKHGSADLNESFGLDKYLVFFPEPSGDWTDDHRGWAIEQLEESAKKYEDQDKMPPTDIIFLFGENQAYSVDSQDKHCTIVFNPSVQGLSATEFKNLIDIAMSSCTQPVDYRPPPPPDCLLDQVCISTSNYYKVVGELFDWFLSLLQD